MSKVISCRAIVVGPASVGHIPSVVDVLEPGELLIRHNASDFRRRVAQLAEMETASRALDS